MANESDNIRLLLSAVDRATAELQTAEKAVKKLTNATDLHNEAAKQSDTIQKRLGAVVAANKRSFLAIAAAATAAAASFLLMGKNSIDAAEGLLDLSKKTGVSVEELSTLVKVFEEAGSSAGDLQTAFKEQAKAAVESTKANSSAATAYGILGISARDATGRLKEPLPLFLETADALSKVEDASLKSALAQNIFGRSAVNALPAMSGGAAGMTELQARYASFGLTVSTQTAKQADEFNDKLKQVQEITKGAAKQLAVALLPTLIQINDFLIRNAGAVQIFVTGFAGLVTTALAAATALKAASIGGQLLTAVFGLGPLKNLKDYKAALELVAATKLGPLVIGIAAVTAAVAIGVTGWQAYQAAKQAATSAKDLSQSQFEFKARIEDQIVVLQRLGKITEEEATRMQRALDQTFDAKNPELQARAIEGVARQLREVQGVAQAGAGRAGGGISLLETPEILKAKLDASLAQIKAAKSFEDAAAQRTQQTEDRALEQQLKSREITVAQFEQRRFELVQQRLDRELNAEGQVFAAEKDALVKQQQEIADRLRTTTPEQRLADPGAIAAAEQQQIEINSRIEVLELEHQGRMQDIRAGSEAAVAAVEDDILTKTQERAAEEVKLNQVRAGSQISLLEGQSKELENQAAMIELLNRRNETESSIQDVATLRLEANDVAFQAQIAAEELAFQNKLVQIEQENLALEDQNFFAEEAERVHQENLLLIAQDSALRRVDIETRTSDRILAVKQENLNRTATLFGQLAALGNDSQKEGFNAFKAFASAEALINTYRSVQSIIAGITSSTGGFGLGLAIAEAAVATAVGLANVAKINSISFAEGGLVPGAPSSKDNRIANVATGEYIFDARSVQAMGPRWFAGMHAAIQNKDFGAIGSMSRPRNVRGFAGGGLVGEEPVDSTVLASGGDTNVSIAQTNTRNQQREFLRQDGLKIVMDELTGRGNQVIA